jgi:beta-glucosidase/6-phospho-beta-glucosidase/beta-galactosidase
MKRKSYELISAKFHFGVGIEDTFIVDESFGLRKLDEYELTQHYSKWEEDLRLAADLGIDSIRWGVPWHLVEPKKGIFDWSWTDKVISLLDELNLECIVDLMHYGTPLWLDNSFLNESYSDSVAEYARQVSSRYKSTLRTWTPLNEPMINAIYCGKRGLWPPFLKGDDGFCKVLVPIVEGIQNVQRVISEQDKNAKFVHVDAGFLWSGEGFPEGRDFLNEWRFLSMDLVMGKLEQESELYKYLVANGIKTEHLENIKRNAVTPDAIGVNYYPGFTSQEWNVERSRAEGAEAGVHGFTDIITLYAERYKLPIFITETSRGGDISERLTWLQQSVDEIVRLRNSGVNVVGYTWFPFFALVDWLYREEEGDIDRWMIQMGIYDLGDSKSGLKRLRTPAVDLYKLLVNRYQIT